VIKNRVAEEIGAAIVEMAIEQPAFGQVRIAMSWPSAASRSHRLACVACGLRHDLETMKKR
jgi:hypothetical protein